MLRRMPKHDMVGIERDSRVFHGPPSITRHRQLNLIYVAKVSFWRPRGEPKVPGWKVGWSTNLPLRIAELQRRCDGEATLVALGVGAYREEQAFHDAIPAPRDPRGYGWEWYLAGPEFDGWLAAFPAVWRGSICVANRDAGCMWWKSIGVVDAVVNRLAAELGVPR